MDKAIKDYGRAYELLTEKEAAAFLRMSVSWLQKNRCSARHKIPFVTISKSIRYKMSDLVAFIEANTKMSTSESVIRA